MALAGLSSWVFELFPLTFKKFLIFKEFKRKVPASFKDKAGQKNQIFFDQYSKYYQEYLEFGDFPRVVLQKNHQRKKRVLEAIFQSYFEIDVKKTAVFKQLS